MEQESESDGSDGEQVNESDRSDGGQASGCDGSRLCPVGRSSPQSA